VGERTFMRKRRNRKNLTAQRPVALPRLPPRHDAFVLALMTGGADGMIPPRNGMRVAHLGHTP